MISLVISLAAVAGSKLGAAEISLIGVDFKIQPGHTHFKGCTSGYDSNHFIEKKFELEATIRSFENAIAQFEDKPFYSIANVASFQDAPFNSLLPLAGEGSSAFIPPPPQSPISPGFLRSICPCQRQP